MNRLHRSLRTIAMVASMIAIELSAASAQAQDGGWQGWPDFTAAPADGSPAADTPAPAPSPGPTAGVEPASSSPAPVQLEALLTADGQRIEQGIVWRVYTPGDGAPGNEQLVGTHRDATPTVKLAPGAYIINAAFGRAHMSRRITVKPGEPAREQFVLNAGGLRVKATVNGAEPSSGPVAFSIFDDERDQFNNRTLIMSSAKTGIIHRLNAGLYQVASKFGDANVAITADVTVEAGKLTEVTLSHTGAPVTFRLVARQGGEAVPEAQWLVQTRTGETVKETVGALPTHFMAPGPYTVIAKSDGREFRREFEVAGGEAMQVEVVMR